MPYPDKPQILTSYTAKEQALGDGSLPGQELDVDLANLQTSTDQIVDFLKLFTRSDGKLANGIVGQEALASSIRIGFDPPEVWATGRAYTTRSTAFQGFGFYLCTTAHTSSVFATDLASGRWQLLADLTPPGGALLASNNLSDLSDIPAARATLGFGSMATLNAGTASSQFRDNGQNDARFQPIGSYQVADPTLTALAAYNTNGLLTQTGADTFTGRSIAAGTGISVTNGNGVSGNPTVAVTGNLSSLAGLSLSAGDLVYATGANTFQRLPKGTAGQVLQMNAGATASEWATASGSVLLGTINTTSGTSQSLGSLVLTPYKFLKLVFDGVSGTASINVTLDGVICAAASGSAAGAFMGVVDLDLSNGVFAGMVGLANNNFNVYAGKTSYRTSTTSITLAATGGNFDAGSVLVYGVI